MTGIDVPNLRSCAGDVEGQTVQWLNVHDKESLTFAAESANNGNDDQYC